MDGYEVTVALLGMSGSLKIIGVISENVFTKTHINEVLSINMHESAVCVTSA